MQYSIIAYRASSLKKHAIMFKKIYIHKYFSLFRKHRFEIRREKNEDNYGLDKRVENKSTI